MGRTLRRTPGQKKSGDLTAAALLGKDSFLDESICFRGRVDAR